MSQTNPGQIQVRQGLFSQDTCTTENDLVANQAVKPAIRNMLEMKNKRYLMSMLTSPGAIKVGTGGMSYYVDPNYRAKSATLSPAREDKGIGNNAYRFDIIGRIEKSAPIVRQQGSSGADGSFSLIMQDQTLYPTQSVRFPSGYMARVQGYPTGSSSSGWLYNFKSLTGTAFSFSTHVGTTKSCFPMYTINSEGSLRSDSRDKKPDTFINHMTIQRKTCAITGGAQSDVLWYEYADGEKVGWMYWKLSQAMAQLAAEKERWAWWGVSSMKNSDGSLRTETSMGTDPETGLPIICGDGFVEQMSGTNTLIGSGTNGEATEDDFAEIMNLMQTNSNVVNGITWVCVTGTQGFNNAQVKMQNLATNQNVQLVQIVNQTNEVGGAEVNTGFLYKNFNINGNSVMFIIHTMLDDAEIFPTRGNDGQLISSSDYYFIGLSTEDKPTMEILCKEANGIKRDFVQAELLGLTGKGGLVQSEVDVNKYAMLSESMFNVYNTQLCGIIYKAA